MAGNGTHQREAASDRWVSVGHSDSTSSRAAAIDTALPADRARDEAKLIVDQQPPVVGFYS